MPLADTYIAHVHEHTRLLATWLPNAQRTIGDYGTLVETGGGPDFEKLARLDGIQASPSPATTTYDFTVDADRLINASASAAADAGVTSGKALLEVKFHNADALSFSAPDGVITRVDDLIALGERLITLQAQNLWDWRYCIVIEVVTVPKVTILIAQKAGAEIKFEVDGNTPINPHLLANLDATSSLKVSKGVSGKIIGEGPLTPLYRVAYLKSRFFKGPEIKVYRGHQATPPEQFPLSGDHYLELS